MENLVQVKLIVEFDMHYNTVNTFQTKKEYVERELLHSRSFTAKDFEDKWEGLDGHKLYQAREESA